MKKLFLSMAVIAALGVASCGAEKEEGKEGKEEKKELSKTDKISEELCKCNDKEVTEMAQCMNEVQSNHADVTDEEIKEIMDKSKDCVEEMQAKMQEHQKKMMEEAAAANDTAAVDAQIEDVKTVTEAE